MLLFYTFREWISKQYNFSNHKKKNVKLPLSFPQFRSCFIWWVMSKKNEHFYVDYHNNLIPFVVKKSPIFIWNHSFSTHAEFYEKLTFLTPYAHIRGVRNISFSGNFAYVLNVWLLSYSSIFKRFMTFSRGWYTE